MRVIRNFFFLIALSSCAAGCNWFGGFRPSEVIKHPDAPVLIAEVKGEYARGYVWDSEAKELTDFGWFHLDNSSLANRTILTYDWEKFVKKAKAKAREIGSR